MTTWLRCPSCGRQQGPGSCSYCGEAVVSTYASGSSVDEVRQPVSEGTSAVTREPFEPLEVLFPTFFLLESDSPWKRLLFLLTLPLVALWDLAIGVWLYFALVVIRFIKTGEL